MNSEFGLDVTPGSSPLTMANARLRALNGPKEGICLSLNHPTLVIGREMTTSEKNIIDLGGFEAASPPTVSRRHAEIAWVDTKLKISDLNSTNGTRVNGKRVVPITESGESWLLSEGDCIQIGNIELLVTSEGSVPSQPSTFEINKDSAGGQPNNFFLENNSPPISDMTDHSLLANSELYSKHAEENQSASISPQYVEERENKPPAKTRDDFSEDLKEIGRIKQRLYDNLIKKIIDYSNRIESLYNDLAIDFFTLLKDDSQLSIEYFGNQLRNVLDRFKCKGEYDKASLVLLITAIPFGLEDVNWMEVREQIREWLSYFDAISGDSPKIAANLVKSVALATAYYPGIVEKSQEYFEFLGNLLTEAEKSGASEKIIYPILRSSNWLLDENFAQVFRASVASIFSGLKPEIAQEFAEEILQISTLIHDFPDSHPSNRLAIAMLGYQVTLPYLKPGSISYGATKYALGLCYFSEYLKGGERKQNLLAAEECFAQAIEIYSSTQQYFDQWLIARRCLGVVYRELAQFDLTYLHQAENCFLQSLEQLNGKPPSLEWALHKVNLGLTLQAKSVANESIDEVVRHLDDALAFFTKDRYPFQHVETLSFLGAAYQTKGDTLRSKQAYCKTIENIEVLWDELILGQGWNEDKQVIISQWNQIYENLVELCIARSEYAEALEYVERSKARSLVQSISKQNIQPKVDISSPLLEEFNCLRKKIKTEQQKIIISQFENLTQTVTTAQGQPSQAEPMHSVQVDRVALSRWQQRLNELLDEVQKQDPSFNLAQRVKPIQWTHIQDLIENQSTQQTVILEWYITSNNVYAFIIGSPSGRQEGLDQPILVPLSVEAESLLRLCSSQYSDEYLREGSSEWQENLTTRLSQVAEVLEIDRIIRVILEQVPKCDKLILVPHKFLHRFPLHALPLNDGLSLFERFRQGVCYAPSCQLLQLTKRTCNTNQGRRFFAVQNPTNDLEYADIEMLGVQRQSFFSRVSQSIYAKKSARKAVIQGELAQQSFNYLHFSCHAEVNFVNPIASSLVLADGEFTLGELFEIDLSHCQLVTLSGCETGRIPDSLSEISNEYISLSSVFLYAGSSNVVSSLWRVDDLSTAFLMIKFYENLDRFPNSIPQALNQAQLWLLMATKAELQYMSKQLEPHLDLNQKALLGDWLKRLEINSRPFSSPYYWAAFYTIGL